MTIESKLQENECENVIHKMGAIFFQRQCV